MKCINLKTYIERRECFWNDKILKEKIDIYYSYEYCLSEKKQLEKYFNDVIQYTNEGLPLIIDWGHIGWNSEKQYKFIIEKIKWFERDQKINEILK